MVLDYFRGRALRVVVGTVLIFLLLAGGAGGSTIFEDDFNSYTDGNLAGQGGWVNVIRGTDFDIQGTTVKEGTKAVYVKCVSGSYCQVKKTGSDVLAGKETFYVYPAAGIDNDWGFHSIDGTELFRIEWGLGNFVLTGATSGTIGTQNNNQWNLIEVEWLSNDTVRARVNSGSWTSYISFENAGDPGRILIEAEPANAEFYFDYIAENPMWQGEYRKKITIDHTKIDSDLTDFPVLVKLDSSNFDFSKARSDGYDIRFTSSAGTLLKYERERHDAANQKAEYWVKIPSVSSSVDTDFYIYYGNSGASDGADPTNVWDSNFKGVWHLKEDPSGTTPQIKDSTSNNNHLSSYGIMGSGQSVEGKIGKALNFDGFNDYLGLPAGAILNPNGEFEVEMWINADVVREQGLMAVGPTWGSRVGSDEYFSRDHTTYYGLEGEIFNDNLPEGSVQHSSGTWYYVSWSRHNAGNSFRIWTDNAVDGNFGTTNDLGTGTLYLAFAQYLDGASAAPWDGKMDELKFSSIRRSDAWRKASYYSGTNYLLTFSIEENTRPAPVLTTIAITPASATITSGSTQTFTASGRDQNGAAIAISPAVFWTSSNTNVGTINSATGVFTANRVGTTTITARNGSTGTVSGTATVTVTPGALASVIVSPSSATVVSGQTQSFAANGYDTSGNAVAITPTWSSSNTAVGTISSSGVFTAIGTGTTTITASSGSVSGTVTITVTPGALAAIAVSPSTASLSTGQTQQFTAAGRDANSNAVSITPVWSSSNTAVGTISASTGMFTALSGGTTTITASSGAISGSAVVTVIPAPLAIIFQENFDSTPTGTLPTGWQIVYSGAGTQYQTVTNTNSVSAANSLQLLGSYNWGANVKRAFTSNADLLGFEAYVRTEGESGGIQFVNFNVGTWGTGYGGVGFSNGFINAGSNAGSTNLVPYQRNTWYKVKLLLDRRNDTYKVWINDTLVGENLITRNSHEIDSLGFNSAWDTSGTSHKFYFDDVKVFTLSALTSGQLASIVISPGSATMTSYQTQQFTAAGRDANGNAVSITPVWSSSNTAVGTIGVSTGMFTALAGGTTTITAASGAISGSASVTVTPAPLAITASQSNITANTPTYVTFTVTSNGVPVSGATVSLSGAATGSGTTDINGQVTLLINAGIGTITATASKTGYTSGTTTLTVASQPVLTVTSSMSNVTVNTPTYVTFTVSYGNTPVSGATVSLSGAATGSGTTDTNGQIAILINAALGTITATASKTGYTSGTATLIAIQPPQPLTVTASPSSVIVNTPTYVTFNITSGGVPVSGAVVSLSGAATGSGTTDTNGQVTILINAGLGTITTTASKTGHISGTLSITSSTSPALTITANPASVPVNTPTYVTFNVTANALPVSGAVVSITGAGTGSGTTDINGQVTILLNAALGTITATASKTGYTSGTTTLTAVTGTTQQLAVNATPSSVPINSPTYVTFTVTAGNSPVSNALVSLNGAATGSGTTENNGQVTILLNAAMGTITATASKTGYTSATTTLIAVQGTAQQLVITANPSSVSVNSPTYVTFTVTAGNSPVSNALVSLSGAAAGSGTTDNSGQVRILINAALGTITATSSKSGYTSGTMSMTVSEANPMNITASPANIPVNIPTYVTFRVTSGGSPVSNAIVHLSGAASGSGTTDTNGRVVILVNPAYGTITATSSKTGYTSGTTTLTTTLGAGQQLQISANPQTLSVNTPAYVTFTVTDGETPVSGAIVFLTGGASGIGTTDANGRVTILINAAFGTVTATASKTGYSSGTITLSTGQEVPATGTVTPTPSPIVTVTPTSSGAVTRTMPASVSPEALLTVTIAASPTTSFDAPGYQVTETLPQGFTYINTTALGVNQQGNTITFTQIGSSSFTYNVMAPSGNGSYTFGGIFRDEENKVGNVQGTSTITVGAGTGVSRYDANSDGRIQRSEAVTAVMDFFTGAITRQQAIEVVMAFFSG